MRQDADFHPDLTRGYCQTDSYQNLIPLLYVGAIRRVLPVQCFPDRPARASGLNTGPVDTSRFPRPNTRPALS